MSFKPGENHFIKAQQERKEFHHSAGFQKKWRQKTGRFYMLAAEIEALHIPDYIKNEISSKTQVVPNSNDHTVILELLNL